jgi:hypothetical protein
LRFWLVTLPVLFWTMFLFLMWFPGLDFNLHLTDDVYFLRSNHLRADRSYQDSTNVVVGPFRLIKQTPLDPGFTRRGFRTENYDSVFILEYLWDGGLMLLIYKKK